MGSKTKCLVLLPPFYAHIFDFVRCGSSRRHGLASDLHMLKHTHSAACFPVWGNLSPRARLMHWFNLWMQRECGFSLAGGSVSECTVVGMCVCVCVCVRLNGMLMDGKDISSPSVSSQMTFLHVADPQIRTLTRAMHPQWRVCMLPDACWSVGVVQGFRLMTCLYVLEWNNENVCLLQMQMNASFLKTRSAKMAFVLIPLVGMSVTARLDSTMMRANYSVLVRSKIPISM